MKSLGHRGLALLALGALALVADLSGCGTKHATAAGKVTQLTLVETPIPNIAIASFKTSGTYPQFTDSAVDVTAVNAALTAAINADEDAFRTQYDANFGAAGAPAQPGCSGVYHHASDAKTVVANSVVVSTMYATEGLYPCGNDGEGWFSATFEVPSASPVTLSDLFRSGSWLTTIAADAKQADEKTGDCAPQDPSSQQQFNDAFAPKLASFPHFAITTSGLDLGLDQGVVGPEACGTPRVSIAWASITPLLSPLGQRLAASAGTAFVS